ncbi:ABC transporter ATP-binding protein [Pseudobacillus badius]|uniref:ABC transporter ATP-binding protein n=1 Tax=Bacillus badius TaxID=1455 RepID=UPI0007B0530A|nr:ABC transporter ATP-binding protein [Bacillus badius]KZO01317.1 bacitracin ABC transporter ATP-binding protein [Bacillus badius]MED0665167.1 ABC transporter ATP-binding protein [Bacillus badius]OCS89555.1 bacitracin ABC transporter ATP-binding protein [Bacillus badius]OVE49981.1 bacitracin ABC transporter ATP-binding protein [Bacillus badius]TDW01127.1 ABC-2 type transport system ATP-binding protein [Bacillus badius]
MENVIEVKHLVKSFENKTALKRVDFNVKKGETIGFLGPSGSGKTTIIKILTAQLHPTSGEVKVFNEPIHKLKTPAYMKKIGILTDNSGLYERLSIYDNLALYGDLYEVRKSRINEVLEAVNLLDEKKQIVQKLSKGMKQRVTLARAILHKPDLLFLDEPTSALDPVNTKYIHEGLKKLNEEGTTIFLTTHDMQEAEVLCDRVAFLHDGEIRLLDTPQSLRAREKNISISLVLKGGRTVVVKKDEEGAKAICDYIQTGELLTIHSNEPTLGDIFVRLTGRNL